MKRKMVSVLILALLNLWMPYARAEISQELDPMVSLEAQATVTGENSSSNAVASQAGNIVTPAAAVAPEVKAEDAKKEKTKKEKSKKEKAKKKSSEKKSKKSSSKSAKKSKNKSR